MKTLQISIERNGNMIPAGTISGNDPKDACFQYLPAYLTDAAAAPISIRLPLREEPYAAVQTAAFFEGLLPEGFTRRSAAQWMHVDESDYLSLLHGLGRECLGAICVTEESETVHASYGQVTEGQIRELAAEGAVKSAEIVTKSHLSLAGASGKIGLYYAGNQKKWYLPEGTAPSTHIVKQSHVRLDHIVTNEQLALLTAARLGIPVPDSFILNTGNGEDREVLFATERYDRVFQENAEKICELPKPSRLHQEDFAQAMGIPASQKYEREGAGYMNGMFDLLRRYSSDPITDQARLWDILVFDFLIGNTDAHVKNFSLLYSPDLKSVRLAPAYDIISTAVYEQSTRDMAFCIGGEFSMDAMDEGTFLKAAKETGLGTQMAMRRFDSLRNRFTDALESSAEELAAGGYQRAYALKERILQNGGIRRICTGRDLS